MATLSVPPVLTSPREDAMALNRAFKGGAGETSHIRKCVWSRITSILIRKVELVLANMGSHPLVQNLEVGKAAFPVVITTAAGLLLSPKFPAAEAHYLVVVGFLVAGAVLWNGMIFGTEYPRLGNILQLLGSTLGMCVLCFLVASFLPIAFSWLCCLSAALFLLPLIYIILIKPLPAAIV